MEGGACQLLKPKRTIFYDLLLCDLNVILDSYFNLYSISFHRYQIDFVITYIIKQDTKQNKSKAEKRVH